MGAFCDEAFSLSQQATAPVFQDRRHTKTVRDNVHGNIYLDPLSLRFIDTEQFQRLRDVKQLGICYQVYPGAVHSRFEHSLGVYWLAGEAIQRLKQYQGAELDIDPFDISTIKLAGLLHDVGHGPFSHVFDNEFIPRVLPGMQWSHEQMSVQMIDYIVDEHHVEIDADCIRRVKEMIVASCDQKHIKASREKQFLFDIVANGRNGIDVDKFDYIERDCRGCGLRSSFQFDRLMESMRVMDDEICYRAKEYLTVHKLFETRAELFRVVYLHPKVKALELMLVDALLLANGYLQISSQIYNPADYWKLDDSVMKTIETASDEELQESQALILRMRRRDLYRFCNEYSVPEDQLEHFKEVTPKDIVCAQTRSGICLKEEDVAVSNIKIDLTRGRENPLNSVHFFQDYESDEKLTIEKHRISHLLPASYQDRIVRVYSKKPDLVEAVSEAFENFQLRTYGIKAQVHGTPDSKKRKRNYRQ
uniref:HD domain-containing protein n=1 Tax=Araucaria cunninghamii TaxID=56994 RepID=A0A0D6R5S2_ARACU